MQASNVNRAAGALAQRPILRSLVLAGVLGLPALALAQALPLEIEGTVSAISKNDDGSATLTVFNRPFIVPPGATISTPTKSLSIDELVDPRPFPGRSVPGFVGGTAIMVGEVANGVTTVHDVAIEPAETVLLGEITANAGGVLQALGIPLEAITDTRMPPSGVHNTWGFPVKPETIPVNAGVAVEGYFGDLSKRFHYFLVEASGGELVDNVPQTSILRARCDPGGRLEVQGGSFMPANSVIEFRNAKSGSVFGRITTTPSLEDSRFGEYRYRVDVNNGEIDSEGACPSEVKAVNLTHNPQTEASAQVDGVTAPPPVPETNFPPLAADDAVSTFVGLATNVELLGNDTDINGNATIDPTSVQLGDIPSGLTVANNNNGTLTVTAPSTGIYTFTYTVADSSGARSNAANVSVQADVSTVDAVEVTRANYRTGQSRWNIRGTTNKPGSTVTLYLVRNNQELGVIAAATADAAGLWTVDIRNSDQRAANGDVVRAKSSAGGVSEMAVAVSR